MHGRLPYLAKPKAKARFVARLAKHQRETMTAAVVRILAQGEPTKFAFEGACRHGLRSQLCLEGTAWAAADKFAAAIVGEALRRIGAVRPPWADGQPDAATFHGTERFYCKNCGRPIPNDRGSYGSGMPVRFCSDLCDRHFQRARSGLAASACPPRNWWRVGPLSRAEDRRANAPMRTMRQAVYIAAGAEALLLSRMHGLSSAQAERAKDVRALRAHVHSQGRRQVGTVLFSFVQLQGGSVENR